MLFVTVLKPSLWPLLRSLSVSVPDLTSRVTCWAIEVTWVTRVQGGARSFKQWYNREFREYILVSFRGKGKWNYFCCPKLVVSLMHITQNNCDWYWFHILHSFWFKSPLQLPKIPSAQLPVRLEDAMTGGSPPVETGLGEGGWGWKGEGQSWPEARRPAWHWDTTPDNVPSTLALSKA